MESLDQSDLIYLNNANDGKAKAEAVIAFVLSVLTEKYGLKEGDQVTPDGSIIRVGSYAGKPAEDKGDIEACDQSGSPRTM